MIDIFTERFNFSVQGNKVYFINNNIIYKLLTFGVISKIGIWSYSLYLWHYPLFSFSRHIYGSIFEEMIFLKLLITLLSIILSIFSFQFIEPNDIVTNINRNKNNAAY